MTAPFARARAAVVPVLAEVRPSSGVFVERYTQRQKAPHHGHPVPPSSSEQEA
jgi:hypothetical protein